MSAEVRRKRGKFAPQKQNGVRDSATESDCFSGPREVRKGLCVVNCLTETPF